MPNAFDLRAAARQFRLSADQLPPELHAVLDTTAPARFVGGPARTALEQVVADVDLATRRAAFELRRLAALCEWRAELTDTAGRPVR